MGRAVLTLGIVLAAAADSTHSLAAAQAQSTSLSFDSDVLHADSLHRHVLSGVNGRPLLTLDVAVTLTSQADAGADAFALLRLGSTPTPTNHEAAVALRLGVPVGFSVSGPQAVPMYMSVWGGRLVNSLFLPMLGYVEDFTYVWTATLAWCDAGFAGPECTLPIREHPVLERTWPASSVPSDTAAASVQYVGRTLTSFEIAAALSVNINVTAQVNRSCLGGGLYYATLPALSWVTPPSMYPPAYGGNLTSALQSFALCFPAQQLTVSVAAPRAGRYYVVLDTGPEQIVHVTVTAERCPSGAAADMAGCSHPTLPLSDLTEFESLARAYSPPANLTSYYLAPAAANGSSSDPVWWNLHELDLPATSPGLYLAISLFADVRDFLLMNSSLLARAAGHPAPTFNGSFEATTDAFVLRFAGAARDDGLSSGGHARWPIDTDGETHITWEIPHPVSGQWTLLLAVRPHTGLAAASSVPYLLNATLSLCSLACASPCWQADDGPIAYGTCACQQPQRYGGENCNVETQNEETYVVHTVLLTVSNLAMLPAIIRAGRQSVLTEATAFTANMVASFMYHACDQSWYCASAGYSPLQDLDFVASYFSIILVAVLLTGMPPTLRHPFHIIIIGVLWYTMMLPTSAHQTTTMKVGLSITGTAIVLSLIWSMRLNIAVLNARLGKGAWITLYRGRPWCWWSSDPKELQVNSNARPLLLPQDSEADDGQQSPVERPSVRVTVSCLSKAILDLLFGGLNYRWRWLCPAIVTLVVAVSVRGVATNSNYWILHSLWHVFVFSSAFFFVMSRTELRRPLMLKPLAADVSMRNALLRAYEKAFEFEQSRT